MKIFAVRMWRCALRRIIPVHLLFLMLIPQSGKAWINGYLKQMQTIAVIPECPEWLLNNMVHNRIDGAWQVLDGFQAVLGVRNRLIYGDLVELIPDYAATLEKDPGYWNWSRIYAQERSYLLHSIIDRAYIDLTRKSLQMRIGRQRINWGMNLIWNPNDLFNSYSYLDFDYEERPGRDAVLVSWYTEAASFLQAVIQPARNGGEAVVAGLYRFNRWGYDLQVLTGRWAGDWVLGAGWSGQMGGGAFRGEGTYFHPCTENEGDRVWVVSLSADYTLRCGFYGQISMLYNSCGKTSAGGSIDFLTGEILTPKTLTRSRLNGLVQLRYPITPLVTGEVAIIHNPYDRSSYLAPSIAFSLSDMIDFLIIGQILKGADGSEFGGDARIYHSRLRWSF